MLIENILMANIACIGGMGKLLCDDDDDKILRVYYFVFAVVHACTYTNTFLMF